MEVGDKPLGQNNYQQNQMQQGQQNYNQQQGFNQQQYNIPQNNYIPQNYNLQGYKHNKSGIGWIISTVILGMLSLVLLISNIGLSSNISSLKNELAELKSSNDIAVVESNEDEKSLGEYLDEMGIDSNVLNDNSGFNEYNNDYSNSFVTDKDNLFNDLTNNLKHYTFKGNDYYEDSIGYTHIMIKVEANSDNKAIKITQLTSDSLGNILDKRDDVVAVSKGHLGCIELIQDKDKLAGHNDLVYEFTVEEYTPLVSLGSDNFEVEKYNLSDDTLYVTLQAYDSDVSSFSGIGILLYKNGNLIDSDIAYPLDGFDSTGKAICSAWIYGSTDFDEIEFYYE